MCVHPWTKGSQPGGDRVAAWLSPTKLHAVDQDAGTDHPRVPALLTFAHAVQSFGLFSWCFMSSSPQTGFSATFSSRAFLQLVAAVVHKPLVQTSSNDRTHHSFPRGTELTEYKCQSRGMHVVTVCGSQSCYTSHVLCWFCFGVGTHDLLQAFWFRTA